jgi:hypothetical protein
MPGETGEKHIDTDPKELRRYNLVLPRSLFSEVQAIADAKETSVAEVLRRFVRLGLTVENSLGQGGRLIIKEGDKETKLIII